VEPVTRIEGTALPLDRADVDTDLSLPSTGHALAVYYIIAPSEASANLALSYFLPSGYAYQAGASMWENMERTRQFGFGDEVKRRIMLGTYALSSGYYDAYYVKAQRVRTLIRRELDAAFERFDVLLTPTSPTPAFRIGEKVDDPLAMYLNDVCTLPINIAGIPGMSIPCGFVAGLPVGLQIDDIKQLLDIVGHLLLPPAPPSVLDPERQFLFHAGGEEHRVGRLEEVRHVFGLPRNLARDDGLSIIDDPARRRRLKAHGERG